MSELKRITSVEELNKLNESGELTGLFDLPNEVYHAGPGISSSGLKEILRSPAHYQVSKEGEKKETPAMALGTLIHLAVLEPDLFASTVVISKKFGRSKDSQAEKAVFLAENKDKKCVDQSDYDLVTGLAATLNQNPMAMKLLAGNYTEVSAYWTDEKTGVLCKVRADIINADTVIDLKSCINAVGDFKSSVKYLKYHLSAAYYLEGFSKFMPANFFAWLAVEKSRPYGACFYAADQITIETGNTLYREALDKYAECLKTGKWPGYPMKFETISIS